MTPEYRTTEDLFYQAIELDEQSREAFLAEACGENRRLRDDSPLARLPFL